MCKIEEANHCVRLAGTGLSVGEHGTRHAARHLVDNRHHGILEQLLLCGVLSVHAVIRERLFLALALELDGIALVVHRHTLFFASFLYTI